MVSASSLAHFNSSSSDHSLETVEIDPQYAESLGFKKGDVVSTYHFLIPFVSYTLKVEVGLLYDLPIAKSVATEPLTPDDWEILVHMHDVPPKPIPQFIFRNCMQNTWSPRFYLRFASPHLTRRWMSGYLVAPVSVYAFVRGCLFSHRHNAEVIISVSFEPSSAKAVLLSNDTELSVAPKTRRQWNSEKHIVSGKTTVAKSDPAMASARKPSYSVLLRVLPVSVSPHHLPSPSDLRSVVFVSQRMLSVARLEGLLPSDPNTTLIGEVKRLDPPTDPGITNQPPSETTAIAKVLNPSDTTKREDVEKELLKIGHVKVIGMDGIPEGQMIIVGGVDGVEDWDVVRQVPDSGKRNASQNS